MAWPARFADVREAFARVDADFCCIVTPPAFHQEAVELAYARGMDILSEKPIADTLEECAAIARAVSATSVRMMVTQNYCYERRIQTLQAAASVLGPVNYAVARYASDFRVRGSWAMFRHVMPHSLLIEDSIHHFDQIRHLRGTDCLTMAGWDWNPGHVRGNAARWRGSDAFDHEVSGLFVMRMVNGSFASYEGNNLATGKAHGWHAEYYRIECEGGAAILDSDHVVRIEERNGTGTMQTREDAPVVCTWRSRPSSSTGSTAARRRRRISTTTCNQQGCSLPPSARRSMCRK